MTIVGGTATEVLAEDSDPAAPLPLVADSEAPAYESEVLPSTSAATSESTDAAGSSWEFSATPYIWFSGLSGDIGVFPALQPVDVDLSFTDLLDHLKFAATVVMQARKGRFVALADIAYVDIGASENIGIRDPEFLDVELDTSTFMATAAAGYRAVDQGPLFVDLLAGLRVTSVDTRLELTGPLNTVVGESTETWVDPVIAARGHVPIGEKWALALYGDIGGFGVGSDITWQLLGTIQYQLGRSWWLAAGWRQYAIDYEKDGFVFDVSMGGPIIGVSFNF